MTVTAIRSAYPPPVADLIPKARAIAERTGRVPSRNRLMRELKVGAPKATAIVEALQGNGFASPPAPATAPSVSATAPAVSAPPVMPDPGPAISPISAPPAASPDVSPQVDADGHPGAAPATAQPAPDRSGPDRPRRPRRRPVAWPVLLLAAPAFVAIWSGWVELGALAGFGVVNPLPGIADGFTINTAITLPIGMEAYAAYALWVWLSDRAPARARRFARWSALLALAVGAGGQVAYHLMAAAGITAAPWPITTAVACLPVAVLGMGAALAHLLHTDN